VRVASTWAAPRCLHAKACSACTPSQPAGGATGMQGQSRKVWWMTGCEPVARNYCDHACKRAAVRTHRPRRSCRSRHWPPRRGASALRFSSAARPARGQRRAVVLVVPRSPACRQTAIFGCRAVQVHVPLASSEPHVIDWGFVSWGVGSKGLMQSLRGSTCCCTAPAACRRAATWRPLGAQEKEGAFEAAVVFLDSVLQQACTVHLRARRPGDTVPPTAAAIIAAGEALLRQVRFLGFRLGGRLLLHDVPACESVLAVPARACSGVFRIPACDVRC
jgi:hypothetical protein